MENSNTLQYWNDYLAVEEKLLEIAEYVALSSPNLKTHSNEIAKLLHKSGGLIESILKEWAGKAMPGTAIKDLQSCNLILQQKNVHLYNAIVYIDSISLNFKPWNNWKEGQEPDWYYAMEEIKKDSKTYYYLANLQNLLYATGALLVVSAYYNFYIQGSTGTPVTNFSDYFATLPKTKLMRL